MTPLADPLVSVITVCRNAREVIGRCIDSVNEQTCPALEHIVVDGNSSDGTQQVVTASRRNPGSRLSQFVSEADAGIYDAMNKGVGLARGRFLYFLNADDRFFNPRSVEAVVRVAETQPARIIQTRIVLFDPSSGTGSLFAQPGTLRRTSPLFRGIYHQSIWAERTLFQTYGRFDSSFRYCGDVEWLMRVLKAGVRCFSSDILTTVFLLGGASADFDGVKAEQRRAELRHYSPVEWTVCKLARRVSRPIDALARSLQT